MAIDNPNVIDAVSIKNEKVILTISDHLEWDEENEHLLILQNKINSYLDVIQNNQIYRLYPQAINKEFVILLYVKYEPNKGALKYLTQIKQFLEENGYNFEYKHLS